MSAVTESRPSHSANRKLGVIILGASVYPHFSSSSRHLDNESFARSAAAFRSLIEDEKLSVFPKPAVLDLFDVDDDPISLIRRIKTFIRNEPALTDVLFYYCGHGDFLADRQYYLTLKGTEPENEAFTGLPLRQMRVALDTQLLSKRVFLVLDCCFSGRAWKEWMATGIGHVIEEDVLRSFPTKGTALIAAAAAGEPAVAPAGERLTMFTGALVNTVSNGVANEKKELSFRDIVMEVGTWISDRYGSAGVAPQIHASWQPQGDITSMPFFTNRAFAPLRETKAEREIFESAVAGLDHPLAKVREAAAATLEDLLSSIQSAAFRIEILEKLRQCDKQDDSQKVRERCRGILARWPEPSTGGNGEEVVESKEPDPIKPPVVEIIVTPPSPKGDEGPKGPRFGTLLGVFSALTIFLGAILYLYFQNTSGPLPPPDRRVDQQPIETAPLVAGSSPPPGTVGGAEKSPVTTQPAAGPSQQPSPPPVTAGGAGPPAEGSQHDSNSSSVSVSSQQSWSPPVTEGGGKPPVEGPETNSGTQRSTGSLNIAYSTYYNFDLPGGDLRLLKNVELKACVSACNDDSECQAYQFDQWNKYCFLKSRIGELTLNPRSVSGIRSEFPTPTYATAPARMQRYPGKIFPGSGYRSLLSGSVDACVQVCERDRSCIAYTFVKASKQCRLFASTGEFFPDRANDSGIKTQLR